MAIPNLDPVADTISSCLLCLRELSSEELDTLYCQFWRLARALTDHESEEADQYVATILAIEEVRQYASGEVNAVRRT